MTDTCNKDHEFNEFVLINYKQAIKTYEHNCIHCGEEEYKKVTTDDRLVKLAAKIVQLKYNDCHCTMMDTQCPTCHRNDVLDEVLELIENS